ncbi:efflux RND transporter periplasmic adaptor subunit [Thiorhodococcus mannitoliphagus]|uniref:Efflux RND transporter periplasmic adaptor subunit n=1 Tax=Thiorhodococcus mannitoliphagus TaxID=329406 RepID=A0A6P1DUD2_9GAMM|nr:efflux RND transporter periplasmic adaptor subunit [Thiorhodococcus mannitoliphagus]NEX21379.1 efflux RND transporter periplasmic adaptor subunit [Thiorhodococcus mannitoliphagus]
MVAHVSEQDSRTPIPNPPFARPMAPEQAALRIGGIGALVLLGLALTGCDKPASAPTEQMPPPSVIAVKAEEKTIEDEAQFVGRVVAVDRVELMARVEGFLKERLFKEGQRVEEGDVLFQIEPDQYQAVVEQRQADVEKAKADSQNADAQLARGLELLKSKNIARAKVDELEAAAAVAKASIAQAQAALTAAKLDLSYTRITAPVAGRIGLAAITVGNLVGPASGTLATIVSRDPIYLQFPVTQRQLLEARKQLKAKGGDPKNMVVQVRLPDGTLYAHSGRLDFVDVTTDQGTDSVTLRADIPNPDGLLVDGQFISVVLQSGEPESTIVIPQSALQVDQQGVFVLVVDADSKAQVRRVQTGPSKGGGVAVMKGLEVGDLVITQGVQKVRPGQEVKVGPAEQPDGGASS